MKKVLLVTMLLSLAIVSWGQVSYLQENEIEFDILHWHYDKYNNAESDQWYKTVVDGKTYFGVSFVYEDQQYKTLYDDKGRIISEKKIMSTKDLPVEIKKVLDYRIVKYKVKDYVIETLFEYKNPIETHHRVDARTKTGGQVLLWFNEDYDVISNKKELIAFN